MDSPECLQSSRPKFQTHESLPLNGAVPWARGRAVQPSTAGTKAVGVHANGDEQIRLAEGMCLADIAHVIGCAERDVIPPPIAAEILTALLALREARDDMPLGRRGASESMRRWSWLSVHPTVAGWLQFDRSSVESAATAYRMVLRSDVLVFVGALTDLGEILLRVAEEHRTSVMPDYGFFQAGQLTTFGHYLLGIVTALLRDIDRANEFLDRLNRCPAGIGLSTGSLLGLDRHRLSDLLGFDGPVPHTRDAVWQTDIPVEALALACSSAIHLDRFADDLTRLRTAEFRVITLSEEQPGLGAAVSDTDDRSPLAFVRATTDHLLGMQAATGSAGRTAFGQLHQGTEDPAGCGDAGPLQLVVRVARLMGPLVERLEFRKDQAVAAVRRVCLYSQDLAYALMAKSGLGQDEAFDLVERLARALGLVQELGSRGATPGDDQPVLPGRAEVEILARATVGRDVELPDEDLQSVLNPWKAIERRIGVGGTAALPFSDLSRDCEAKLAQAASKRRELERALANSQQALVVAARDLIAKVTKDGTPGDGLQGGLPLTTRSGPPIG